MSDATPTSILRVDASARTAASMTRQLTDAVIEQLSATGNTVVKTRDVAASPIGFIDEDWINANYTDPAERSDEQRTRLTDSDALIAELRAADVLVIGLPTYNFGIPASLKAWVDQICRVGETFYYTENGPVGLLEGKRAYVVMASGGTAAGSDIDFASTYIRHVLGFVGISDVSVIAADQLMMAADEKVAAAKAIIADISKAAA